MVHPRACGGNHICYLPIERGEGPSPRLRGKRELRWGAIPRPRSIPAPAGETFGDLNSTHICRVHPRACGGNRHARRRPYHLRGPSPRLRGKLSSGDSPR